MFLILQSAMRPVIVPSLKKSFRLEIASKVTKVRLVVVLKAFGVFEREFLIISFFAVAASVHLDYARPKSLHPYKT